MSWIFSRQSLVGVGGLPDVAVAARRCGAFTPATFHVPKSNNHLHNRDATARRGFQVAALRCAKKSKKTKQPIPPPRNKVRLVKGGHPVDWDVYLADADAEDDDGCGHERDRREAVDHLGRRLSHDALSAAQDYWHCQRQLDSYPFDVKVAKRSALPVDLLLQLSWSRREYTRRVLGLDTLDAGTRTYEPPYVDSPAPPPLPFVRSHAPATAAPSRLDAPDTTTTPAAPPLTALTEPALCPEQVEVVELAASGRNIFCTGSAGCGKSTVLHAIRRRLRDEGKTVRVMAPTGKAALAINGTTTWTFAGWTPNHHKRKLKWLEVEALDRMRRRRLRETDTIIIDEISMVENLHFERLNAVMKSARGNDRPFGGVQVIVTGDFCQLPPVKPFQHCIDCGSDLVPIDEDSGTIHRCPNCEREYSDTDKWAFRSHAWKECDFAHIHLQSIHRQSDAGFISLLQKCRLGIPFTQDEVDTLMTHRSVTDNAVRLFSTRDEVRRKNDEGFARLKTQPHPYRSYDKFLWYPKTNPHLESKNRENPDGSLCALDDHRFDRRIDLKIGMLVILLVNLDISAGLFNGSQGVIAGFEPYVPQRPHDHKDNSTGGRDHSVLKEVHVQNFVQRQLEDPSRPPLGWPIVRFLNGETCTILPECSVHELGDRQPYSLLCRTQIPLAPAWAMSIHKSQGMTLDRVVVDLSRAFEEGQVYVALSRARTLEGLKVEGDAQGLAVGKGGNPQVREFLRDKFGM